MPRILWLLLLLMMRSSIFFSVLCWIFPFRRTKLVCIRENSKTQRKNILFLYFAGWRQERTRAGSGVDDGGGSGWRRGVDAIIYNINPQEESSSSSSLAGINLCCGAHIFFLFLKGKKSTPGNIIIIIVVAVCRRCGWVVIVEREVEGKLCSTSAI